MQLVYRHGCYLQYFQLPAKKKSDVTRKELRLENLRINYKVYL